MVSPKPIHGGSSCFYYTIFFLITNEFNITIWGNPYIYLKRGKNHSNKQKKTNKQTNETITHINNIVIIHMQTNKHAN